MSMTKKDFIALADALRATINADTTESRNGLVQKDDLLDALVSFCRQQNPNFMEGRWLDYLYGFCGQNGGKIK